MRGRHKNRPSKCSEEMINKVINHIKRFPTIESHYCRENTKRQYLEEGLSISKMYSLYVKYKKFQIEKNLMSLEKNVIEERETENKDKNEDEIEDEDEYVCADKDEKSMSEKNVELNDETNENKFQGKEPTSQYFVTLVKYREIFNTDFNLGFFIPKKDR